MTQAVVLSGGGAVGIAWQTGVVAGLAEGGIDLARAEKIVGTSAGSAVASNCAVPGLFPPITIHGRRYMDGGIRSVTNADLAQGSERVLVVSVIGHTGVVLDASPSPESTARGEAVARSADREWDLLRSSGAARRR